ncbi:site-specific DNA-methyltransferase [Geovibrio thiophilus]|uniref:site-specific DNA-methyltransferase (adenine-specific) n=1 Tax=Geovibrio thiophilus TaxID=139438 RepID=A0A3R5YYR7_9BACT|nr:site-specific DNA-methyltransferase [Geovibrio thiophilus]QAR32742.1 site-specific DNA-methyltransferase [Geovibrio thiophilus]
MSKKQRLELMWIGKGEKDNPRLEPRILIEDPERSYGDKDTENILIHGDNLLALKALEQDYAGKVKCIYIDPPYNTGNAFEHYDDGLEHSEWLNLMSIRLRLLYKLLSTDGVLFINIDEIEHAYLKVLLDEIFGRKNFIGDLIWKKRKGGGNDSRFIALDHDYILVYVKCSDKEIHKKKWRVSYEIEYLQRYKEVDDTGRYYWDTLARDGLQNPIKIVIKCPDGSVLNINSQKSKETILGGIKAGTIRLTQVKGKWTLHHKVYMPEGKVLRSILDDHGTNKIAGDELRVLFRDNDFDYPKPEKLIQTLLELNTKHGDIVLDSFLGSGTTAAVAHKMGRNWIGVELGEHCNTHCVPRLQKVIDGTDQGGISKAVDWQGGGGFRYYTLAPSLLKKDSNDRWVISEEYNAEQLAAAMAKQEGFKYYPDETVYWKQGYSTETDFIYTTTQFLTVDIIDKIHEEMKPEESLLITCKAFQDACVKRHSNITVKKIPHVLLGRCEFGKDDYSLNIINVPVVDSEDEEEEDC